MAASTPIPALNCKNCSSRAIRYATISALVIGFGGCTTVSLPDGDKMTVPSYWIYDHDVSKKRKSWGGFAVGQVYEAKVALFVMEDIHGPGLALGRELQGPMTYYGPDTTTEEYRKDPSKWTEVTGLIDKGTKMRIVEVHKSGSHSIFINLFNGGSVSFYVKAEILDGPFRGKKMELTNLTNDHTEGKRIEDVDLSPYKAYLTLCEEKAD